ncbi:MAG: GNAT family N-acetyltransferase [Alphaproteobacteria bacterium]|jgi:GNAT superfamily N-acetyltransferase|nr:GNAT family N-acetyltransferase [Alphaproteobacteria bacterium]
MSIAIRSASVDDAPAISGLIEAAYAAGIDHHFGEEGRATFLEFVTPAAIAARLDGDGDGDGWVAVKDDRSIVGYAELAGDHLKMLFVRNDLQRTGIGRKLLTFLRVFRRGHMVTLRAAPNADAFYLAVGFRPTGPKQQQGGVIFTPMEMKF